MPKLQKSFELVITPEQFLAACSLLELQEVELLLDSHIRRAEQRERKKSFVKNHIRDAALTQIERALATPKSRD